MAGERKENEAVHIVTRSLKPTLIYSAAGFVWIIVTELFVANKESDTAFWINIFKGLLYVILTSVLIYFLIYNAMKRLVRLNEQIIERENRYRKFFDSSSDMVFLKDDQLRYIFVNRNMALTYGKPESNIIGKTSIELALGESVRAWHENDTQVMTDGTPILYEETIGGRTYWATVFPVELGDQKTGVGGIVRDITDRKLAELNVKKERDRAEMYLDIAAIIFLVVELDGTVSLINRAGCDILGFSKDGILGKNWIDTFVAPSHKSNVKQMFNRMQSGDIRGSEISEFNIVTDKGEERNIVWNNAILRDSEGIYRGVLSSGIDVTEQSKAINALKESERSKSVLLSNLPGLAYRCKFDRNWTMQFISDGCYDLTGYRPEALIGNRDLSYNDIILEEYREKIWNITSENLKKRAPMRYEYEIKTASGDRKWVYEMSQGVFNEQGKVEALEGIIIDIDESKKHALKIQYISDHDFLTNLYNRQYYENAKMMIDQAENLPFAILKIDINGLKLINDTFGLEAGDQIIRKTGEIIGRFCGERDILARTEGDLFSILMPNTDDEAALNASSTLTHAFEEYNESIEDKTQAINISIGYSVKDCDGTDITAVEKEAEAYMVRRKLLNQKSHENAMLSSIMATMYERSNETEEHARRIAEISRSIGERLELSQDNLDTLSLFSMLHDIGKIGVNDHVLKKPGRLTEEEWIEMKRHPVIGYRIAMSSPILSSVAEYILTHHERWDGKGYPSGMRGEQIPLLSRILSIADAYDAMTHDRVYRSALPHEEAMENIRKNAGTQFDPRIVEIFLAMEEHLSNTVNGDNALKESGAQRFHKEAIWNMYVANSICYTRR